MRAALVATSMLVLANCTFVTVEQKLELACGGYEAASLGLAVYQAEQGSLDATALAVVAGLDAVVKPICDGTQPLPVDLPTTLSLVEQSALRLLALKAAR